ncbi:bifunctional adenosylcobinamide kinase/adenosylcobinamide-phosphate guanylyltransferase [Dysgonomonas sp. 521]|nr:bifunctional adenosylcobinamide kinase/adenosylcobinamide-phosphate guanylyltransferase [Dysgonomonas sp. 521]
MMTKITLITGGQRSGKSSYAQKLALSLSPHPVYLATSRVWDDEHRRRIERHKAEREKNWINIEEEKELSKHDFTGKAVLVDCVTLWATNYFFDLQSDVEASLSSLKSEFDKLISQDAQFIFVTNEIGMGEMSQNDLQRKFADLQGWLNQYIAARADEVYLMVSGIAMKVK